MIRLELVHEFKWDEDAVLLAADGAGLDALLAALTEAQQHGFSRLHGWQRAHVFVLV